MHHQSRLAELAKASESRVPDRPEIDPSKGLSADQVSKATEAGLTNEAPPLPTRTLWQIFRANAFNILNLLLLGMAAAVIVFGKITDALFGVLVLVNAATGSIQELRAKRTLEKLTLVDRGHVKVVRDAQIIEVLPDHVVLDDICEVSSGKQVVADGIVRVSQGLVVDESLLTGESDPVSKSPGDALMSGSYITEGSGRYQATAVGLDSYAAKLAVEARKFTLTKSELLGVVLKFVGWVSWALVPLASILLWRQYQETASWDRSVVGTVSALIALIPEGLVLFIAVALAMGVIRIGAAGVLVRELPAVEGLARVDVVCFDKTGTLTAGEIKFSELIPVAAIKTDGRALSNNKSTNGATLTIDKSANGTSSEDVALVEDYEQALKSFVVADPSPNSTLLAVAEGVGESDSPWKPENVVPFSSERKWSAVTFIGAGSWVLGAPEMLLDPTRDESTIHKANSYAEKGMRVVVFGRCSTPPNNEALTSPFMPAAILVLGDILRDDAAETIEWLDRQGVSVRVISGDSPVTVGALAQQAGIQQGSTAFDGRNLPENIEDLTRIMEETKVFGRVRPEQKREMIRALKAGGHNVAMVGDGVNDVLALKDADMGIAMGSGSDATRAVAQIVLLNSDFSGLPVVTAEGRRVLANVERTTYLWGTKIVTAFIIAMTIAIVGSEYPFLPRHLTLVNWFSVSTPALILALQPNEQRFRPGFARRAALFALPTGALVATATLVAYFWARGNGGSGEVDSTIAAMVLVFAYLGTVCRVARPLVGWKIAMIAFMGSSYLVSLSFPGLRRFLSFELPTGSLALVAAALSVGVFVLIATGTWWRTLSKFGLPPDPTE